MITITLNVAAYFAGPLAIAWFWHGLDVRAAARWPRWTAWALASWWVSCAIGGVLSVIIPGGWLWGALHGSATPAADACGAVASLIAALAFWWWRRQKNRLRSLASLGAKSLARLAALLDALRESIPPPSPLLSWGGEGE